MEEEMLFRGHLWLGLKEAETFHGGGFSCRTWAERARERKLPSGMLQILHGFYVEHGYRLAAFSWCRFVLITLQMPSHFLQPWISLCIKFLGVCVCLFRAWKIFFRIFSEHRKLKLSIHILNICALIFWPEKNRKRKTDLDLKWQRWCCANLYFHIKVAKFINRMVLFWKINSQK